MLSLLGGTQFSQIHLQDIVVETEGGRKEEGKSSKKKVTHYNRPLG
jgi:hypothetical protein